MKLSINVSELQELSTQVLVVGGGAGGTAAAIQAARRGADTVLVSEGDWLGGLFDQYSIGNHAEKRLCSEIASSTSKIEGKLASRVSPLR